MGGIRFMEGAIKVATPTFHGSIRFLATFVVFTAFHSGLYFF